MHNNKKIFIRSLIVVLGFILLTAILYYYYTNNPVQSKNFYPFCTFKAFSGYDCIGCGSQRATHELLNLNIVQAMDYNLFFVLSIPFIIVYIYFWIRNYITGKQIPDIFIYSKKMGIIIIAVLLLFLLLRNISIEPFTWLNSSI